MAKFHAAILCSMKGDNIQMEAGSDLACDYARIGAHWYCNLRGGEVDCACQCNVHT